MRDFRALKIWEKGMDVVDNSYDVIALLPDSERYGLKSQMGRASISIPTNIAEGCARRSTKHFIQFLETSLGSTFELQTQAMVVQRKFPQVSPELIDKLLSQLDEERRMLVTFISNQYGSLDN
jgi:four helix bundle protein